MSQNNPGWQLPKPSDPRYDVTTLQAAHERLRMSKQKLSHTQAELQGVVEESSYSTDAKDRRIQELQQNIAQLQQQLAVAEQQLNHERRIVEQQKATIKNQSDFIQNPKPNNVFATPNRRPDLRSIGSINSAFSAPPPRFDLSINNDHSRYNTSYNGCYPASEAPQGYVNAYSNRYSLGANDLGSPEARRQMALPNNFNHSRDSSRNTSYGPTPPSQPSQNSSITSGQRVTQAQPAMSMALVRVAEANPIVAQMFQKVFSMAEQYAYSHANFPSSAKDNQLPQTVKDRLIKASASHTAFGLMSSPQTRHFLVAKLINEWIVKHILKYSTFRGFDEGADQQIDSYKSQLYEKTPAVLKKMYLNSIGNEVRKMKSAPGFPVFLNSLCKERGNELWGIVKPMMHQKTTKDWDDLYLFMEEAHKLAAEMLMSGNEIRIDMPQANQPFNRSIMVNKDSFMNNLGAEELERRGAVVRVGISPLVTARTSNAKGVISTSTLHLATCLTKWADF